MTHHQINRLQDRLSSPVIRFSEFIGIGYFGDKRQHVIAPIFENRQSAERSWAQVMKNSLYHVVFVPQESKYEFISYPVEPKPGQINYALYRSFSSLASLEKFKSVYGGRTYIEFGWHDLTKPQKLSVLSQYASVDSVEFRKPGEIKQGTLVDKIRRDLLDTGSHKG